MSRKNPCVAIGQRYRYNADGEVFVITAPKGKDWIMRSETTPGYEPFEAESALRDRAIYTRLP